MLTLIQFAVSWSYRTGTESIRRTLYHSTVTPCIVAARIIAADPYSFDVEVSEVDTGAPIVWEPR